jgi:hypothetical protein
VSLDEQVDREVLEGGVKTHYRLHKIKINRLKFFIIKVKMQVKENYSFYENYFEPLQDNPFVRYTFAVGVEVVKVVAAKCFLELLCTKFITPTEKVPFNRIYVVVVLAPVIEEILFRGIFLRCVYWAQKEPDTDEERVEQLTYRVHLTAMVFGLLHWPLGKGPFNAVTAYLGSIGYGYLTEKYDTIALSILAHGIGNFFILKAATSSNMNHALGYLCLSIISDVGFYLVATDNISCEMASSDFDHVSETDQSQDVSAVA